MPIFREVPKRAANRGLCIWPPVSRLPFRLFGGPNRRKSPAVFENIPVSRRLRPETWFERHCRVRAAVKSGIHLSISLDHLIGPGNDGGGREPAEIFVYATASIASGVSFTVVRRNSRRSLRSKRRPRWTVARLSHITRSPTSHLCVYT